MILRVLLALVASISVLGCQGSVEEAEAAKALAPKPMSEEQKKQIESITGGKLKPATDHAGAGPRPQ